MKKQIFITPAEFTEMGWVLDARDENEKSLIVEIDTNEKTIEVLLECENGETVHAPEYTFDDYIETLQDLHDYDHLPSRIFSGNSLIYNDDANQVSSHVSHSEVNSIMDMHSVEVHVYGSFEELNQDCYGFSFQHAHEEAKYGFAE